MFLLLAVAVISAVIFFVLGVFLGALRNREPEKKERELWDFTE